MYKITHFDKKLCHLLRHHSNLFEDDCNIYSIWNFCPRSHWKALQTFFGESSMCKASWFPLVYWFVLAISILGSVYSFSEFTSLYWGRRKGLSMWRSRKYFVLPYSILRKCRLVGSLVMLNAWLLLWYAVVSVSPTHMTPWLTINMFVLGFELITWIIEIFLGLSAIELQTIFSFALPLTNLAFVRCIQNVFQHGIDMDDIEDLRLWKP